MAKMKKSPTLTKKQVLQLVNAIEMLRGNDALKVERTTLRLQVGGFSASTSERIVSYMQEAISAQIAQ